MPPVVLSTLPHKVNSYRGITDLHIRLSLPLSKKKPVSTHRNNELDLSICDKYFYSEFQ